MNHINQPTDLALTRALAEEIARLETALESARHDAKNHECAARMLAAACDRKIGVEQVIKYVRWAAKREIELRAGVRVPPHHIAAPIRSLVQWRDALLRLGDIESAQEIESLINQPLPAGTPS